MGVQNAAQILEASLRLLNDCLCEYYRKETLGKVERLRIAGQMHGIIENAESGSLDCSPLYTWMYPNKSNGCLPKPSRPVFSGFGGLTLLELKEYGSWNRCGTIMDLLAFYLCNLDRVKMSWQLAESFGYCSDSKWDDALVKAVGGKVELPEIIDDDQFILGKINCSKLLDLAGVPVFIPLGDLQASIKSVADNDLDAAYIILGTSSQLCVIASKGTVVGHPTVDILPYSMDNCILAGRSMNGGNAIDAFLKMISSWTAEVTGMMLLPPDVEKLLMAVDSESKDSVTVVPTFIQERGMPQCGATIFGLDHTTTVVQVLQGICTGIVNNLIALFPAKFFAELGIMKLYMVGNAKKPRFAKRIREVCQELGIIPLEAENNTSAAYGAAIF